ncbi:MAG: rRNA maturation RNase YbeY, partial [Candidatus Eisenbacteria bacterium]
TYRGVDRATDVLTFSLYGDALSRGVLGDVYISLETAKRRADRRGIPFEEEVLRLLVHGLLHLVGHTHGGATDTARMRELERGFMEEHLERAARGPKGRSRPAKKKGARGKRHGKRA